MDALIVDLLRWLSAGPQTYDAVLEGWRTSCPRLPVWEEVNDRGFVEQYFVAGRGRLVSITPAGSAHLQRALSADSDLLVDA